MGGPLQSIRLSRTGVGMKQAGTWRVSGLRSVSAEQRVLVVAHLLIVEPWAAGENATDKTAHDLH